MALAVDRLPLEQRLENNIMVEPNSGCWLWARNVTVAGYGVISVRGKSVYVHRLLYQNRNGAIPNGLEIDHKCRTRSCCNPDHLEAVTHEINCKRGAAGKVLSMRRAAVTHCIRGHEFTPENTRMKPNKRSGKKARQCRTCQRMRKRGEI